MKTARIVLLFVIIVVALIGGYFGANMYMQNMAIKKINNEIKKNHWENLVEYGNVKANIFSRSITIQNVKFTLQNRMTSQTIGVVSLKKVVLMGDMDKKYKIKGFDIEFINLDPKFPQELANKPLLNAEMFSFNIHKSEDIVDALKGEIKDITLSKFAINSFKESGGKKFEKLIKIVKMNSPINVDMDYAASIDKGILDIKKYSIDFMNNIGISYKILAKNIDFKGFKRIGDELNKNPKNFATLADLMSKVMQIKFENLVFTIHNYGLIDRVLDEAAKNKHLSKKELIAGLLQKVKMIPVASAYPAVEKFLTHKSNALSVSLKLKQDLTIGDIIAINSKKKGDILKIVEVKFSN